MYTVWIKPHKGRSTIFAGLHIKKKLISWWSVKHYAWDVIDIDLGLDLA